MKKKKFELGKKLFLGKKTISTLNELAQGGIKGGATGASDCLQCHNATHKYPLAVPTPCPSVWICESIQVSCYTITYQGGACVDPFN